MSNTALQDLDVAIVGFGPVGATLAGLLGQRGCHVAVLDKSEQVYPLPRAFALDHEAMRVFQQLGIAPALAPHMTPYRPTVYQGAQGQPIQRFDFGPGPYPLGWMPAYTFNQPALEAALRAAVGAMPTVRAHLGLEVTQLADDGEQVCFTARDAGGGLHAGSARYVVGCDGGSSFVRRHAGMTLRSLEFDEPWVVVDVHVDEDKLAALPETNIQHCRPERPCTYVVGPGTHRRWEFLRLPHEAQQREVSDETLWQLLSPWLAPGEARLWRAATYRFHAVVADAWRSGRILLAGDSAHQMPPFLAQGMCQGIRDAVNLAWKLAWVVQGRAPQSLLDSYGRERGPQVEETTRIVKSLGQVICERDPQRARSRDAELLARQGGSVQTQVRQSLLPGVRHGLIDATCQGAGMPFPQPHAACGERRDRLDELLPRGFLLFLHELPAPALLDRLREALRPLSGHVVVLSGAVGATTGVSRIDEHEPSIAAWMAERGCAAALVRPDHVVYGIAADAQRALALVEAAVAAIGAPQRESLNV